jgi:rhodanese-related sulfurtransferase
MEETMLKHKALFLLLLIASLLIVQAPALAQEAAEVDVLADIVLPRLEEYGADLPEEYGTIKIDPFLELLAENEDVVILDVREPKEIEDAGTIEGAVHIPLRTLGENLNLLPDLDATIVVVCKGGFRGTIGMALLHVLGYENAKVLVGGFDAWVGEELPVVEAAAEVEAGEVPEEIDPLLLEYVTEYAKNLPDGFGAVKAVDLFEEMFEAMPDALIDVRSDKEWADPGYIEGATHIWINEFMARMDEWPQDLDANIVIYCGSSYRGGITATLMGLLGYTNVRNMAGGINAWIAASLPVIKA